MGRAAPAVSGALRMSAAMKEWFLNGYSEIKLFRDVSRTPDPGVRGSKVVNGELVPVSFFRGVDPIGVCDGVRLLPCHLRDDLAQVDFSRHGGTGWDPYLGE